MKGLDLSKRPPHKITLAIICMLVASFFNASMGAFAKLSTPHLSIEGITFWRNAISLVLFFPWVLWLPPRGELVEKLRTSDFKMVFIRSVTGLLAVFLFFYSLKSLPLSNSILLYNTMPIFVPFVAYFWMGFPILHRLWWGIGVAFLGIIFILSPQLGVFNAASFLALAAGLMGAIAMMALRASHYSDPSYRTVFYLFLICTILMAIATLFNFHASWHTLSLGQIGILCGVGVSGLFYQLFITWAAKHGPMRMISSFSYAGVIFGVIFDYLIWGTMLPLTFYLGFILIVCGATLVTVMYPKN